MLKLKYKRIEILEADMKAKRLRHISLRLKS